MKKLILLISIFMLITASAAFADTSRYYFKSMPVIRIYNHSLGYKVVYVESDASLHVIYLPKEWFLVAAQTGVEPKAEIIAGRDSSYPYFSVFWKDGKFSHIRLYLNSDLRHESWGDMDTTQDLTEEFTVETLNLEL